MSRYFRVLQGAAVWGSYYRENPDVFAEEYLHIRLRLFQRILLCMMCWATTFVLIACRGLGKTYISAVYCCIRAILWPGTKICIASKTRNQAQNVIDKIILELKPNSPELRAEIDEKETKVNGAMAQIVFKNTSVIKVVTASDSSRGNRCNVLLLDEFRLIRKDVVDTVLRKFLTLKRMPRYDELSDTERKLEYEKEKNLTMCLSSAYFKDNWSYTKCLDTFRAMLNDSRRQFVCGFPYQLSIEEGLLDPEIVADEMVDSDFSAVKWSMEMDALFYGSAEDAFFDFSSISQNRKIKYPMLPDSLTNKLGNSQLVKISPKTNGEIRILSADIALMSSKKNNNDATSIFINRLVPTKSGRYMSNIVYPDTCEGLRTYDQALMIRKLYDEYECDYIALDTNGIGLGVFDSLARELVDQNTGEIYPPLSCMNDKTMAERCTDPTAPKVIWSIKASAQLNSDCAFLLREGFRSGRIRLLCTEYDAEDLLNNIRGYQSLSPADRLKIQMPYINTTLLVDELTNLQHEENAGRIKVYEKSGMRKDRYSSLSYNYYVALQIENRINKQQSSRSQIEELFAIKPPSTKGKAVKAHGGRRKASWR